MADSDRAEAPHDGAAASDQQAVYALIADMVRNAPERTHEEMEAQIEQMASDASASGGAQAAGGAPGGAQAAGGASGGAQAAGGREKKSAGGREKKSRSRRDQAANNWLDKCQADRGGAPLSNLANAMVGLREDPALSEAFGFDELQCAAVLLRPLPARRADGACDSPAAPAPQKYPRPITDTDVGSVQEYLQLNGLRKLGADTSHQAVDQRAVERPFHPVRRYLEAVAQTWDGEPRLRTWLRVYLGVDQTPYAERIGAMFLISMVARIFEPGAKADYMLVLEGPQGALKSSLCQAIGGDYFSDNLPEVTQTKEAAQHLRGKWLIEIAEMSSLNKAESAQLKAFITRDTERYRPTYGRRQVVEPRQCVFIGTTNKSAYLRDETGGRRFWPVTVGAIDIEGFKRDRDQLFAEATREYWNGTLWWPDREFEQLYVQPQQEARYEVDVWEEPIGEYLQMLVGETGAVKTTVSQVAREALKIETGRIATADTRRITSAMERLGWRRERADGKTDWQGKRWWIKA
jgi:hypothetical protein